MTRESTPLPPATSAGAAESIDAGGRPAFVRASVCAGGLTTAYLRAGNGTFVVVLGARFEDVATNPMIGLMADRHRVVIPDLQSVTSDDGSPAAEFSAWLRAFLDGLGADDVILVTNDDVAEAVVDFVRTDSDRVRRVVLATRVDTEDGDRARCADVPTSFLRVDPGDAHELRRPRTGGGGGQ